MPARDADILNFRVWSKDPKQALALTNAYAPEYTNYRVALDTASLRRAQRVVSDRLRELDDRGQAGERLAQSLQSKAQELDTLQALQTSNATVISTATKTEQIAPRKLRNFALGIIAGVVLAIVVLLALETFDTRVRSENEVEERLGLMPLAYVAAPPSENELVMLTRPNAPEAEAFRLLRANLQFASVNGRPRSLLVTSSVQGEGKSTTIANLAVTMARAGDRVALVDLDLRRPSIRRLFSLGVRAGLTDVAVGHARLDDALEFIDLGIGANGTHGDREGSLAVLGAGTPPPNPAEFIESETTTNVIHKCRVAVTSS